MSTSAETTTDSKPVSSAGYKGSDLPPLITDDPPRVLIAGAGLAGLFLGILLEKAGIPYEIFERSAEIKPLGAIMCLNPSIHPAFEQLGLYEQLKSFSKPGGDTTFYTDQLKVTASSGPIPTETLGYDFLLFARPALYDMLFKQIPSEKIHMSKKILSFQQNHEGVMLRFSDNTTVHGDILVGADGAHSSVRQHLHMILDQQGLLPKVDLKSMKKGYISLVGTTDTLDTAKYPFLTKPECETAFIIGDKNTPYTWVLFSVPGDKICWNVIVQLGIEELADDQFRSSDWVPQQNQKLMDLIRHFKTPYGTLGDLFDATPIEHVSKVYYEDKMFETWTHGRTVLIGDAAHKMLPSTGVGAVNAMQDAVILANCLYDIKPTSFDNIKEALKEFKDQRFDYITEQYTQSQVLAMMQYGHNFSERILRHMLLNWMPKSMRLSHQIKASEFRPQANFIPQVPDRGVNKVASQKPSRRIQKEKEEAAAAAKVAATV
ncbi:hypothetical protein BGZ95_006022 [Linnemannia exigua]|uniref:FAD-binding domain-containing protein n=1 Tax=Linnemannia exigua TaxID=604196 RepID=A0AAD4HAW2_9FUNG|nr:hypothetical protein BGZ95_006022 [Linnemannia exigua]